jgi:hypothetical protein
MCTYTGKWQVDQDFPRVARHIPRKYYAEFHRVEITITYDTGTIPIYQGGLGVCMFKVTVYRWWPRLVSPSHFLSDHRIFGESQVDSQIDRQYIPVDLSTGG